MISDRDIVLSGIRRQALRVGITVRGVFLSGEKVAGIEIFGEVKA